MPELELERVDKLPSGLRGRRPSQLWERIKEAMDEGYTGWLRTNVATEKDVVRMYSVLRYHAKKDNCKLDFHRRRQQDGSYDVYVRATSESNT